MQRRMDYSEGDDLECTVCQQTVLVDSCISLHAWDFGCMSDLDT